MLFPDFKTVLNPLCINSITDNRCALNYTSKHWVNIWQSCLRWSVSTVICYLYTSLKTREPWRHEPWKKQTNKQLHLLDGANKIAWSALLKLGRSLLILRVPSNFCPTRNKKYTTEVIYYREEDARTGLASVIRIVSLLWGSPTGTGTPVSVVTPVEHQLKFNWSLKSVHAITTCYCSGLHICLS